MEKLDHASSIASALTTPMLASALSGAAPPAPVPSYAFEKCYGVNSAGHNDCAASGHHSCAGEAARASDPQSWIHLPPGTCAKIHGGSLGPKS